MIESIAEMDRVELLESLVETGHYSWSQLDNWTTSELRNEFMKMRGKLD